MADNTFDHSAQSLGDKIAQNAGGSVPVHQSKKCLLLTFSYKHWLVGLVPHWEKEKALRRKAQAFAVEVYRITL